VTLSFPVSFSHGSFSWYSTSILVTPVIIPRSAPIFVYKENDDEQTELYLLET
jgi:hypothetical protein